jgi:hypothetical protein
MKLEARITMTAFPVLSPKTLKTLSSANVSTVKKTKHAVVFGMERDTLGRVI